MNSEIQPVKEKEITYILQKNISIGSEETFTKKFLCLLKVPVKKTLSEGKHSKQNGVCKTNS